ncbi:unnamed protein product [Oppiella nova]|uniref:Uncharacterized protein n=1 Tax=Oppiella nova TaxID=334625 RepID=A0A7R9MNR3_9ACAR|nr:unnamed protein product [Oppiella nova]CAG2180787.1 unnamed protein product [Oppiella nova]
MVSLTDLTIAAEAHKQCEVQEVYECSQMNVKIKERLCQVCGDSKQIAITMCFKRQMRDQCTDETIVSEV